jgi:mRNA-degrading endonuclease RelE of RelBE toxin-antitoxin system
MDITFAKASRKYLARCENRTRAVIVEAIEGLPENGDIRMLKGRSIKNIYRLRIGRYRVIYVRGGEWIRILDIDTRGDVYK